MHPIDIRKLFKKSIRNEIADNLPLPMASNSIYDKKDIVYPVIFSVSNNHSVEYASRHLKRNGKRIPSGDDVFYHLSKLSERDVIQLFNQVNDALLEEVKKRGIFKNRVSCALDIHKVPWYGKTRGRYILGIKGIRGTCFGYGYASIECVENGKRFTLSVYPLHQFSTRKEIIAYLIKRARKHVEIKILYLDRGFFDIESMKTLIDLSVPFVIPVIRNERIKKMIEEFLERCKRYFVHRDRYLLVERYTMKRGRASVTFNLVITVERPRKIEDEWNVFVYATNIPVTVENAYRLAEGYRKRWGIETGYRVKDKMRGRTCSRNHVIRLFFLLLSVLLYNLWQLCNLLIIISIKWMKKCYPIILNEFKNDISDFIIAG